MPRHVFILHGWSDDSKSSEPLAKFLKAHGYDPMPVWLGDYKSLDDDVMIQDVEKRMSANAPGDNPGLEPARARLHALA